MEPSAKAPPKNPIEIKSEVESVLHSCVQWSSDEEQKLNDCEQVTKWLYEDPSLHANIDVGKLCVDAGYVPILIGFLDNDSKLAKQAYECLGLLAMQNKLSDTYFDQLLAPVPLSILTKYTCTPVFWLGRRCCAIIDKISTKDVHNRDKILGTNLLAKLIIYGRNVNRYHGVTHATAVQWLGDVTQTIGTLISGDPPADTKYVADAAEFLIHACKHASEISDMKVLRNASKVLDTIVNFSHCSGDMVYSVLLAISYVGNDSNEQNVSKGWSKCADFTGVEHGFERKMKLYRFWARAADDCDTSVASESDDKKIEFDWKRMIPLLTQALKLETEPLYTIVENEHGKNKLGQRQVALLVTGFFRRAFEKQIDPKDYATIACKYFDDRDERFYNQKIRSNALDIIKSVIKNGSEKHKELFSEMFATVL